MAGLIDDPNTPNIGKMKGRSYPTEEHEGVVYVWMGETEPVPLEEACPPSSGLPQSLVHPRKRVGCQLDRASQPGHRLS